MTYDGLIPDKISKEINAMLKGKEQSGGRVIRMYTGVGGADLFDISREESMGYVRVYIGIKVPRLLRVLKFKILKSKKKQFYKLIKK
jgi:hypothetical protein